MIWMPAYAKNISRPGIKQKLFLDTLDRKRNPLGCPMSLSHSGVKISGGSSPLHGLHIKYSKEGKRWFSVICSIYLTCHTTKWPQLYYRKCFCLSTKTKININYFQLLLDLPSVLMKQYLQTNRLCKLRIFKTFPHHFL